MKLFYSILDVGEFRFMIEVGASILNADLLNLRKEIDKVSTADWLHLDVMDGHFVPNLTFGPMFVPAIKQISNIPIEVHLMVENPEKFLDLYAQTGCQRIIIHAETSKHLHRLVQQIKEYQFEVGVALNPATSLDCLEYILESLDVVLIMTVNPGFGGQSLIVQTLSKIKKLQQMITELDCNCKIAVDGGVNWDNYRNLVKAGANQLITGTLIYNASDAKNSILQLKDFC